MLRQSHSSDHSEIHRPVLEPKAAHVELLEAEEGEVSMELATPLLPTTFISPEKSHRSSAPGTPKRADHSSPLRRPFGSSLFAQAPSSPRIEQSLISVEGVGTPERDEPGQPDAEGHFDLDTADLERLVGELDSAGQQVAESEKAINDLADLIVDLERTNLKKSEI
ncbi:hypothetical protein GYMLUDRAFT_33884 [Collybiopsis luxurians FD-317 M1]|nr:hypothetical protein GYMLUDRAFT_33884 [Collybiopsis luxurians FD-317 M1]